MNHVWDTLMELFWLFLRFTISVLIHFLAFKNSLFLVSVHQECEQMMLFFWLNYTFKSLIYSHFRDMIGTDNDQSRLTHYSMRSCVFMCDDPPCTCDSLLLSFCLSADRHKTTPPPPPLSLNLLIFTEILSYFLHLSLSVYSFLPLLELFFITVSRCSKYGALQTADLGWTADPCISNATPKVPRLQGLPLCGCGRSAASVIHPLARSPASEYWFLFPQSPGERARKD